MISAAYKFTGKERDSESTLDYFGARHYASSLGRFVQADEAFADQQPSSPQSWNMYAYVRNNPLNRVDPNGRVCTMSPNGSRRAGPGFPRRRSNKPRNPNSS